MYYIFASVLFLSTVHSQNLSYPEFSVTPIQEKILDTVVIDYYRSLEKYKTNPRVINFYQKQDLLTENFFENLPLAKKYKSYLRNIDKHENDILEEVITLKDGYIFYLKKAKYDKVENIYFKKHIDSSETILLNPRDNKFLENKKYYISSFKPSWNGEKIVIGLRERGAFTSEIVIMDVATGVIENTGLKNSRPNEYGGFHWLPNQNAFTYTSLRTTDSSNPNIKLNTSLAIYFIDTKETKEIFGNGHGPEIDKRLFPMTEIHSEDDDNLIVYPAGSSRYWDAYYTSLKSLQKDKANWKPLFKVEDKNYLTNSLEKDNNIYFISGKETENRRIAMKSLKTKSQSYLSNDIENEVIQNFKIINDNVYFSTLKYGTQAYLYKIEDKKNIKIELPIKASKIKLNSTGTGDDVIWVNIESPLSTVRRFRYTEDDGFVEEHLYNPADVPQFKNFVYKTVEVASHDGELVPMTIIHKEDMKFDSNNAVFSDSYGSFGSNDDISFQTHLLSFVSLGGILVFPHIRGGGAKGEAWHKAGMKTTKENSWKDLIACMDYLVKQKYTSHNKITLHTGSGGAIATAMAVNKRPDVAGALILSSPSLNPSRKEALYKSTSYLEYGSLKDPKEAKALIKMDPYLNIPKEANFPSIYVYHGFKDDRIYLSEPLKYITQIQSSNVGNKPTLLDIDPKGTHNDVGSFYGYYGRIFAFAFSQTNTEVRL